MSSSPLERFPLLIADDNADDQVLIRRAFAKVDVVEGIVSVVDGDEAIEYLAGEGRYADRALHPLPALIILDLKMPRRGGLEVLEWLKAQPGLRRIPVAVLTSSRQREDVDRAYDAGANAYLVKPVEFTALVELARSVTTFWLSLNEPPVVADG